MEQLWIRCVILWVLFAVPYTSVCRNFPSQHFTTENGLPSNAVYSLYRDSKGFLWVGTDKGVARYNGLEFERFTTNDGLADNEVLYFQEDYEGRLWMITYNGELCFYKDGLFHTYANTPFLKKSVSNSFIDWIAIEKDSSVTITHRDKLAILNIKGDKCTTVLLKKAKLPSRDILYTFKISANKYRIVCTDRSFIIDTGGHADTN